MDKNVLKIGAVVVVLFLLLPVLPEIKRRLTPTPFSFDRFKAALERHNMSVDNYTPIEPAQMEATEQVAMFVNGATVMVYRYEGEGKIVKQMEYQKPDSGSVAVEAMGIAQSLGARVAHQIPTTVGRNGMYMLVVMGEDKALNTKIDQIFESL